MKYFIITMILLAIIMIIFFIFLNELSELSINNLIAIGKMHQHY